jgi:hypothetical protein
MKYISEPFVVTLRRVVEVANTTYNNTAEKSLRIRIEAIETTRAEHGNCFLLAEGLNNTQTIRSATADNGAQLAPKLKIEVLDIVEHLGTYTWSMSAPVRIKVGSTHALPGPEARDPENYFARVRNMSFMGLVQRQRSVTLNDADLAPHAATGRFTYEHFKYGEYFRRLLLDSNLRLPLFLPRNSEEGSTWYGVDHAYHTLDITSCNDHVGYGQVNVNTGYQMFSRALYAVLAAMNADGGTSTIFDAFCETSDVVDNGAAMILFQRFPSSLQLYLDQVRPTAFPLANAQYFTWRETIGQIVWHEVDGQIVQVRQIPDEDLEIVPPDQQIPGMDVWLPPDQNLGKNMHIKMYGPGLDFDPVNDPARYVDKMITIPCFADTYLKNEELPFSYHPVLDEDGFVDNDESYISRKPYKRSARFFVLADVGFIAQNENDWPEISVDFDLSALNESNVVNVVKYEFPKDLRGVVDGSLTVQQRAANWDTYADAFGVGNVLEIDVVPLHNQIENNLSERPILSEHMHTGGGVILTVIQDMVFSFKENRTFFLAVNDALVGAVRKASTTLFFQSRDCVSEFRLHHNIVHAVTRITKMYTYTEGTGTWAQLTHANDHLAHALAACSVDHRGHVLIGQLGPRIQSLFFGDGDGLHSQGIFDGRMLDSRGVGPVFQSQRRISQHLCGPVLNPNSRIGCTAPLNYETMHLPPELRDFQLEFRDIDFSFLPGKVSLDPLVFYDFDGGNQAVAAEDNLLHLPQFREFTTIDIQSDGSFDMECFSPYGMPSYIAMFARDQDHSRDHMVQPLIKQLSIMCNTTMKKSDTVLDANVHQLYHITQRNVNQRARYNRFTFNKRQVILMSAEDVGLMGLQIGEYQTEKRAVFRFSGIVNEICRITVLLIYNNRGLYVEGKQLGVIRLQN